jgi:hypothetical protein
MGLVLMCHRYQEETRKAIESINAVMSHLGAAAVDLLTDRDKLLMLVAGGTALALGVYGAREGVRVAGKTAEMWLGTPKLVSGGALEDCCCQAGYPLEQINPAVTEPRQPVPAVRGCTPQQIRGCCPATLNTCPCMASC